MTDAPLDLIAETTRSSKRERWRRAAYRFRQNRLSIVGLILVILLLIMAAIGPYVVPYPEHVAGGMATGARFQPPSLNHWFGTNELGQDVFSLTIAGAQMSLFAGLAVVVIAAISGTLLGAIAGYFGGWIDEGIMRFTDLNLAIPSLILAMAIASALSPSIVNMVIALAFSWWPGFARLARGEVIARKEEMYVTAARAIGANPFRILLNHVLPNIMTPVIVKMSLDVGFAILAVAALGFIGIGVRPPTPEWGSMLSIARSYMPDFWWTAIFPGMAIFVAVFAFNLLGDGLRDIFDPKARR